MPGVYVYLSTSSWEYGACVSICTRPGSTETHMQCTNTPVGADRQADWEAARKVRNPQYRFQGVPCSLYLQRLALGLKAKQTSDFKTMYSRKWQRKNQLHCIFSQADVSVPSSKVQFWVWIDSKERVGNEKEAFACSRIAHQCNQVHPERGHPQWQAPAYTRAVQATGAYSKPWEHIVVQNPGCPLWWGRWKKPF